jgi:hypothetical protein
MRHVHCSQREDSEVLHLTSGPRSAVVESTTMAANTTANEPMDDGARKAAHDVLGVQIYPGTEIMADGTVFVAWEAKIQD